MVPLLSGCRLASRATDRCVVNLLGCVPLRVQKRKTKLNTLKSLRDTAARTDLDTTIEQVRAWCALLVGSIRMAVDVEVTWVALMTASCTIVVTSRIVSTRFWRRYQL